MQSARIGAGLALALGLLLPAVLPAEPGHPLLKDKTGLHWTVPFSAAQAKAKESGRLLMIKPVAFGTSSDGGW